MQDDQPLPGACHVDRASDAIAALHAHFPQFALQVADVRHPDLLRPESFQQLGDSQKAGANVGRHREKLGFRFGAQRNRPRHQSISFLGWRATGSQIGA
jgi:hypothetical protein